MHLVIDLSDVTMIDATGWGVLFAMSTRLDDRGGSLLLAQASQRVRRMYRMLKVGRSRLDGPPIPLYESVQEAVRAAHEDAR